MTILFRKLAKKFEEMGRNARIKRSLRLTYLVEGLREKHREGEILSILDVGGTVKFWETIGFMPTKEIHITLLNLKEETERNPPPHFTSLDGDGTNLERFENRQFHLVVCHSVLAHVGSSEKQYEAAKEIRRVGKNYFVQTPNKFFPVCWRTGIPFFHLLPRKIQVWAVQHIRVGMRARIKNPGQAVDWVNWVQPINRRQLLRWFPGSTLHKEGIIPFLPAKSFTVIGKQ